MIESAQYDKNGAIVAVIGGKKLFIPDKPGNRHRQMIAEWEAEGNAIEPYVPPPEPVPSAVSMFQARAALLAAGLYEAVDAAMQQAGGVNLVAWEYATEVRRDSDLVKSMAAQLNLTDEQVDSLFAAAHNIKI